MCLTSLGALPAFDICLSGTPDDFNVVFRVTELLGSGQFGQVNKGIWDKPGGAQEVAIKTLKEGAMEEDKVRFLQEAAISGQFQHPNVVRLQGVVTVGEPVR